MYLFTGERRHWQVQDGDGGPGEREKEDTGGSGGETGYYQYSEGSVRY